MSAILFHQKGKRPEARVSGAERAMMGKIIHEMNVSALGLRESFPSNDEHPIKKHIVGDHYCTRSDNAVFRRDLDMATGVSGDIQFKFGDEVTTGWRMELNTALAVGNDVIRLMVRLHAQCEIHAWVSGKNRKWMAGVIERGLKSGLMRPQMGWDSAVKVLLSHDDDPVVTSYTVCDSFPNADIARWKPTRIKDGEADWDEWHDKPSEEQWELAIAGLMKDEGLLEIAPDQGEFHFGSSPINGYQVMARAWAWDEEITRRKEAAKK